MSVSGGEAKGSGGSVSYSAGQLFYMTHSGADGYVSEGVTDHLMLRIDRYNFENLEFQLFDVTGRMVKNGLITGIRSLGPVRASVINSSEPVLLNLVSREITREF